MDRVRAGFLWLDQTPDVQPRRTPRTYAGAAATLLGAVAVAGLLGWFIYLYTTEATTAFVNRNTLGTTHAVRFRCVSSGGCNVTYEYGPENECGHLAGRPGLNVTDGDDFTIDVCRSRDAKEGVRVRTVFDTNVMWYERNVLWMVELYQEGNYVPVGEVSGSRVRIQRLRNTALVDKSRFMVGPRTVASLWSVDATDSILFDDVCFTAAVPFPLFCGSYQFTLSELFVEEVKVLSNNLRADVVAPTFAVISGIAFFLSCVVRVSNRVSSKDDVEMAELCDVS